MRKTLYIALSFCFLLSALSFESSAQRRQLKWANVMLPGTPNMLAGWDENGNPAEVERDTASGGGGGITNSAATNELMKSNGTNAIPSGLFSTTIGDLTFGNFLTLGTTRTVGVAGSESNIDLELYSKGTGEVTLTSGTTTAVLSNSDFRITTSSQIFGVGTNQVYNSNRTSAATNSVETGFQLNHLTSGTPAAGIGVGLDFGVEGLGGLEEAAYIQAVSTDVTSGSEDFDLVFSTMSGGATASERFRIKSYGGVNFSGNYNSTGLAHAMNVNYVVNGGSSPTHATLAYGNTFTFGTNNQVYYGAFINPTLTAGAFTGTKAIGIYYGASGTLPADHYGLVIYNGKSGFGVSSPSRQVHIAETDVAVNSVSYPHRISHLISSGTEAAGIGVGMEFEVHTSGDLTTGICEVGAIIETVATDVTASSEDFDLIFKTMAAGATVTEKFRITSNGRIIIPTIPTSCAGEQSGTIWSDAGTLKVCP